MKFRCFDINMFSLDRVIVSFVFLLFMHVAPVNAACLERAHLDDNACEVKVEENKAVTYGLKLYMKKRYKESERFADAVISGGDKAKNFAYMLKMAIAFHNGKNKQMVQIGDQLQASGMLAGEAVDTAEWLTPEQENYFNYLFKMSYGFSLSLLGGHDKASLVLRKVKSSQVGYLKDVTVYYEVVARSCMRSGQYECAKKYYLLLLDELNRTGGGGRRTDVVYYNLACNESLNGGFGLVGGYLKKINVNQNELLRMIENDNDFVGYRGVSSLLNM